MRHYHLVWVWRLSNLFLLAGFVVIAISWFDTSYAARLLHIGMPLIIAGILPNMVINVWLSFTQRGNLQSPSSPEGLPVEPSGIWVDEDFFLHVGSRVLALSQGLWHRAVVIDVRRGNRVVVHFTGWDSFWDEVIPRSRLQVDTKALLDDDSIDPDSDPGLGTAIREKR